MQRNMAGVKGVPHSSKPGGSKGSETAFAAARLTVVVPVGRDETAWVELLESLREHLPSGSEVIVSGVEEEPASFGLFGKREGWRWRCSRPGRAPQMNDAAFDASGDVLWFLHADSHLPVDAVPRVFEHFRDSPNAISYFGLRFYDGPRWLRLNEIGVELRCQIFGLPFGDQGFFLSRETFERLGGFDETTLYGEDHLLIWAAKRSGVPIQRINMDIGTSGRKYAKRGWLRTTARHLWLTARQAIPAALRFRSS